MTSSYEEVSDWEALRKFRALPTDTERLEQMFMTSLGASRTSNQNTNTLRRMDEKLGVQNGKVADHEARLFPLERDRSIWNWVLRACIVGTPIAVVVANYLTKA